MVFKSFGKYINSEVKKLGWKIDNVYDLARILRVSETINHKLKSSTKCDVISYTGVRYQISDFMQVILSHNGVVPISKTTQNVNNVLKKCEFIKYCKDNTENLPEPL